MLQIAIKDRQWRDASRCVHHGERGQCNSSRCKQQGKRATRDGETRRRVDSVERGGNATVAGAVSSEIAMRDGDASPVDSVERGGNEL